MAIREHIKQRVAGLKLCNSRRKFPAGDEKSPNMNFQFFSVKTEATAISLTCTEPPPGTAGPHVTDPGTTLAPQRPSLPADGSLISDHSSKEFKFQHLPTRSEI